MTHTHIEKWNKGRLWLWDRITIEWKAFTRLRMLELSFFGGDSDADIRFTFACGLFYFTIALEDVLPHSWRPKYDWETSFGHERVVGLAYHDAAFWISLWHDDNGWSRKQPWYMRQIVLWMPWDLTWVRTSTLLQDNTWLDSSITDRLPFMSKKERAAKYNTFRETHPYEYVRKSGVVQKVNATISVEEREWRPRWSKWTSLFAKVRRTIDVEFSDEVGEQAGSWKGGVLGCGYVMKPGETPYACLLRMQSERRFN